MLLAVLILFLILRRRIFERTHRREVQDKTNVIGECRIIQALEYLFHINNCRPLTCCSHCFCLKDSSRALTLIEEILMINFLFKYHPWLTAFFREKKTRRRKELRSLDLSDYKRRLLDYLIQLSL